MIRRAEKSLYIRDHGNRLTYRAKLARARRLVYDSGNKPLEVEHGRKLLRKLLAEHEVFGKRADRALTAQDFGDRGNGMLYPLTEHSRSRRGIRAVEHPKERSAFVFSDDRLAKLEIASCGGIHLEKLRARINRHRTDIRCVRLLRLFDVRKRTARRKKNPLVAFAEALVRFIRVFPGEFVRKRRIKHPTVLLGKPF